MKKYIKNAINNANIHLFIASNLILAIMLVEDSMKKFTIKDVSEIFQIPKSTLRYWEKEEIIHSTHNAKNNYRYYSFDDLMVILDILFYRNLNFTVEELKNIYHLTLSEQEQILFNKSKEINQEIKRLIHIQESIQKRLQIIREYKEIKNHAILEKEPTFSFITPIQVTNIQNTKEYLHDPTRLAIIFQPNITQINDFGLISNDSQLTHLSWKKRKDVTYFPCLVCLNDYQIDYSSIAHLLDEIKTNYEIQNIIGHYLITDQTADYYKCWIEAIPK